MKKKKSNLDERQEQILLKIESNGCWFAFWGLLAALVIQQFIYGINFRYVAGEWAVFMVLAVYLGYTSIRNGIWDRRLKADARTNLLVSAVAAAAGGIIMFAFTFYRFPETPVGAIVCGILSAIMVFVPVYVILLLTAGYVKKRQRLLEEESRDE